MRTPKILNHPNMHVIMRKDLCDKFSSQLNELQQRTGATYVGHNIIKNYGKKNHTVSTFCNREEWHDLYWEKYYLNDSLEKACHTGVQNDNFAAASWQVEKEINPCCQERLKATQTKDGLIFSFKRKEDYYETFMFGWNQLKTDTLDIDYLCHLSSLLKPLKEYHWAVHNSL